jgi:hypothetical protein
MQIYHWLTHHWAEIGVIWLVTIKWLTVIQDACDAQPKDLKPPFGKLLYYMSALSQSLFLGNRPAAITPTKTPTEGS